MELFEFHTQFEFGSVPFLCYASIFFICRGVFGASHRCTKSEVSTRGISAKFSERDFHLVFKLGKKACEFMFDFDDYIGAAGASPGLSEPSASLGDVHGKNCRAWAGSGLLFEPIDGGVVQWSATKQL